MNIGELGLMVRLRKPLEYYLGTKMTDKDHIHFMVFFDNWAFNNPLEVVAYGGAIQFFGKKRLF